MALCRGVNQPEQELKLFSTQVLNLVEAFMALDIQLGTRTYLLTSAAGKSTGRIQHHLLSTLSESSKAEIMLLQRVRVCDVSVTVLVHLGVAST